MNIVVKVKNLFKVKSDGKNSVRWLSHHIPKTAGTSLKEGYAKAFGKGYVKHFYSPEEVKLAGQANMPMLPVGTQVLHGHFHAHPKHTEMYPNARRIVWVRDPVERAWSLLGHLLAVQQNKDEYQIIFKEFGPNIEKQKLDVFTFFLTHPQLKFLNRPYQNHFSKVPIGDFDFIGRTSQYGLDLRRLSRLMGTEIPLLQKNVRDSGTGLPDNRSSYSNLLEHEYNIVENYL